MEFDGLRIALLLIGVLIIVGVYAWDRIGKRSSDARKIRREPALHSESMPSSSIADPPDGDEPVIGLDETFDGTGHRHAEGAGTLETETAAEEVPVLYDEIFTTPGSGEPADVIVVNIVSQSGRRFTGMALDAALRASGMEYGAMRIYHRMDDTGDRLFSLVNSVEPGYFEPDAYEDFSTPGVSMFLALPGPTRPAAALEELIATAELLVRHLDGRMLDQDRNPLRTQGIEHLRERVREFERQQQLVGARR